MADILSQNQIDDLLNALQSGDMEKVEIVPEKQEKKVKKYDFRRPDKFAKEQLRSIETIHENLAQLIENYLNGYLRTFVDVTVISTESMVYSEFMNSVSNPAILGIVDFSPLDGQIVVDLGMNVAYTMIEKLLGGCGKSKLVEIQRPLTEIEETLIRTVLNKITLLFRDAWSKVIELNPKMTSIVASAQFAQVIAPSDSVALVCCEVVISDVKGMLNIVLPYYVLEPIMSSLSATQFFSNKSGEISEESIEALRSGIKTTNLPVKTIIGKSNISVYELLNLHAGDVLVLNTKVGGDMDLYVSDELKFKGVPGVSKKKMALKITKKIEKGENISG